MKKLGLIGFPLGHSFSKKYFSEKFEELGLAGEWQYELYPLERITELSALLKREPELVGLNITIPYKEAVLPYLSMLSPEAAAIGAVNTITIQHEEGKTVLAGHNTDVVGFRESLLRFLGEERPNALVLGTGGAAKAAVYVLKELGIGFLQAGRNGKGQIAYTDLMPSILQKMKLIINCTPLGTFPNVEEAPPLPYRGLTKEHFLFDMVYNPEESRFLREGRLRGARTKNGLEMLQLQAEAAWDIWQGEK
jgi:shikimate dehydrogenase